MKNSLTTMKSPTILLICFCLAFETQGKAENSPPPLKNGQKKLWGNSKATSILC